MPRSIVRIALLTALVAGQLVPGLVAPVHAITRPETLARQHAFSPQAPAGSLALEIPATHAMLSWVGDEESGVQYRFEDDGAWTRWRGAPESHDMERARRHYSSPLFLDRSVALEWRARGGARGVTLHYVNTLDGPLRRIEIPAVARAGATEPNVVTRAEWGANESLRQERGCGQTFHPVQQMFVHHTVTSNDDSDPAATVRAIYEFHVNGRGWCDIGYNFLVARNGQIFEGRWARSYHPWEVHDGEDRSDRIVTGAHVSGFNSGSIGVSVLGTYTNTPITKATRRSLVSLLAWEADRHDLNPKGWHTYRNPYDGSTKRLRVISGHRDAGQTSCPGARLYRALPSIRKAAARMVGSGKVASVLEGWDPAAITAGETSLTRFRLTRTDGVPLEGKRVTFYKRVRAAWESAGYTRTNARGWAKLELQPKRNVQVAAVWRGDKRRWGDETTVKQKVRPVITLEVEGALETTPGRYELPQGTTKFHTGGTVRPKHPGDGLTIRVWESRSGAPYIRQEDRFKRLDETSAYRLRFLVPVEDEETGVTYRLKTILTGHEDHARGRSRTVEVVVPPCLALCSESTQ